MFAPSQVESLFPIVFPNCWPEFGSAFLFALAGSNFWAAIRLRPAQHRFLPQFTFRVGAVAGLDGGVNTTSSATATTATRSMEAGNDTITGNGTTADIFIDATATTSSSTAVRQRSSRCTALPAARIGPIIRHLSLHSFTEYFDQPANGPRAPLAARGQAEEACHSCGERGGCANQFLTLTRVGAPPRPSRRRSRLGHGRRSERTALAALRRSVCRRVQPTGVSMHRTPPPAWRSPRAGRIPPRMATA